MQRRYHVFVVAAFLVGVSTRPVSADEIGALAQSSSIRCLQPCGEERLNCENSCRVFTGKPTDQRTCYSSCADAHYSCAKSCP